MTLRRYVLQSLAHRARANLAVILGVMTGSAVLTGALLVGDSMRGSLRDRALSRLGDVEYALIAPRFFGEGPSKGAHSALGNAIWVEMERQRPPGAAAPSIELGAVVARAIILPCIAQHASSGARSADIQAIGFDDEFWAMAQDRELLYRARRAPGSDPFRLLEEDEVRVNEAFARELSLNPGDEFVLTLPRPSDIPLESLMGRKDSTAVTLRLRVAAILEDRDLATFGLRTGRLTARNVFIPLQRLQAALHRDGLFNAVLIPGPCDGGLPPDFGGAVLRAVAKSVSLSDLGLQLRMDATRGHVVLESSEMLLRPPAEHAAHSAAERLGASTASILAYLANDIETADRKSVPYSIVAGIDAPPQAWASSHDAEGKPLPALEVNDIFINAWTAQQLDAKVGDALTLRYFVSRGMAPLTTQEADFRVAAILPMDGPLLDAGFAPAYPGITDARKLSDWDPPFPFDFKKIRDDDEAYWDRHRAAPKAFVNLARAQSLWADQPERHGRLTSIRLLPKEDQPLTELAQQFEKHFLASVDPADFGFVVDPVRRRALESSRGTTDFSGLFIGFSFFLIASAAMLVALLFRLGVEQRAREIGLLSAVGFTSERIRRILLSEGAAIVSVGSVLGLPLACGYAWLMLAGLRTWWSGAASAPFLTLHVTASSLAIGWATATLVALGSMALALRGVLTLSTRGLLAGAVAGTAHSRSSGVKARRVAIGSGAGLIIAGAIAWPLRDTDHAPIAFFIVGVLALVSGLAVTAMRLHGVRPMTARAGRGAWVRMGVGNAPRHRGRSLLTIALIASATFLVCSLAAFRLTADDSEDRLGDSEASGRASTPQRVAAARATGTGGFALLAETTSPLPHDISTEQGRKELDLPPETLHLIERSRVFPFRFQRGDETSCQGLYAPTRPRILGASSAFIARGGFAFSSYMKDKLPPDGSPWNLLDVTFTDGAIPAIGDEASVRWQLHSGPGRDLEIEDESGRKVALRFVALLKGSALQSELIVNEADFVRLFPSNSGHGFFLIEPPQETPAAVELLSEAGLPAEVGPSAEVGLLSEVGPPAEVGPHSEVGPPAEVGLLSEQPPVHRLSEPVTSRMGEPKPAVPGELNPTRPARSLERDAASLPEHDPARSPADNLARVLERDLARFGFDAMPVRRRMEGYFAVQNTYLATFQTLGGFGLVLGTIGLTVVLLRNVFERRAELALMQALGFSPRALTWIVLSENVALTLAGLAIGLFAAALAVAPHLSVAPHTAASAGSLGLTNALATTAGVLLTTLATGRLALRPTLRGSLITALRSE
ncbi:MAG: ABC transporter permease [Phycisphaerales bacterium]|nr:ABC transporter permease [Phycisphaerales bacterium]